MLVEVVAAHAEDAGGLARAESETRAELRGRVSGAARTWLLGASDRRDLESKLLSIRPARHVADCNRKDSAVSKRSGAKILV